MAMSVVSFPTHFNLLRTINSNNYGMLSNQLRNHNLTVNINQLQNSLAYNAKFSKSMKLIHDADHFTND